MQDNPKGGKDSPAFEGARVFDLGHVLAELLDQGQEPPSPGLAQRR